MAFEVYADLVDQIYKVLLSAQVGRETEVDCALAELYVRTLSTEHLVKDTAHSDIFNSIYTRMNEVSCCTSAGQPMWQLGSCAGQRLCSPENPTPHEAGAPCQTHSSDREQLLLCCADKGKC